MIPPDHGEQVVPAQYSWVGAVGTGPIATVGPDGTVRLALSGITVSVWVGAEDRWHVSADDPGIRQAFPEALPVPQTLIRVPGGDVEIRTFGAIGAGPDGGAAVMAITNSSSAPVALAIVASPEDGDGLLTVEDDGIFSEGSRCVIVSAGVRDAAAASSRDELARRVVERGAVERGAVGGEGLARPEFGAPAGAVAAVIPLSHSSTTTVTVVEPSDAGQWQVPGLDNVIDGWEAHLGRTPQVDLGRDEWTAAFRMARSIVAMGAGPGAGLGEELLRTASSAVLGELYGADVVIEAALRSQRSNGRVDDVDGRDATTAFVMAATAMWDAGLEREHAEALVGPLAKASHWLGAPRRWPRKSRPTGALETDARTIVALDRCAQMLVDLDQPDAAARVASFVPAGVSVAEAIRALSTRYASLLGGATWTGASAPQPARANFALSAELVDSVVWSAVRTSGRRIHLCEGWTAGDAGTPLDIRGVSTRLGTVSASVRWHGERPALLWEIDPRPGVAEAGIEVVMPVVDASWSSSELSGETLLEAPATPRPAV